jgi:hypothetical protein
MTLTIDKQIHVLMDPWVALPDYDSAEDLPEHVGNMEILVRWGVPKEERERRNAARPVEKIEEDIRVRNAIRVKAVELGIDVAWNTIREAPLEAHSDTVAKPDTGPSKSEKPS